MAEREASYYQALPGGKLRCSLCPHSCLIGDGKRGICGSRMASGGKLWALSYGKVCSIAVDPVEKKPLSGFMPGTRCLSFCSAGCNLSCRFCQNHDVSQVLPEDLGYRYFLPEDLVEACKSLGCPSIAYTYTEPLTWWEFTYDTSVLAREAGLKNILVSAGYVSQEPLRALVPYLDAANIDLKAFDDDFYRKVCSASLLPVLRTLSILRDGGVHLEITNLLVPGLNDSPARIRDLCLYLADNGFGKNILHLSRFFPRYRMKDADPTPIHTMLKAKEIALSCGIETVCLGNV